MQENELLVSAKDLKVRFDKLTAIENVSLEIRRGDFLAIIGPNGSGKTVLIRTLLGLLPYEGTITTAPGVRIGYVPQQIDWDRSLSLTLKEFLELKLKIAKLPHLALASALAQVGLPEKVLNTPLRFLSGGQVQKGLIAFALLGNPDVIFFDEPTASVDSPGEEQIYETMHRLQDENNLSIVLVSHELDLVKRFANKIICINRQMICFGDVETSMKPEMLEKLYGGLKTHVHQLK